MRDGLTDEMLAGGIGYKAVVSSWKGVTPLASNIPVRRPTLSVDGYQSVPETFRFSVPEFAPDDDNPDGRSWVPGDDLNHPLAEAGQYVEVDLHIFSGLRSDRAEPNAVIRMGRFKVQNWDHDDARKEVSVECLGLFKPVEDAKFRTPLVPRPTGTLGSELRRIMLPGIPVQIDPALTDRPVPQSFVYDDDRLEALYNIAAAWPARLRVDQYSTARLLPPVAANAPSVITWTDGKRGTVISVPRSGSRDEVANVVVGRATTTDAAGSLPLVSTAVATGPLSPTNYGGEIVEYYSSPLVYSQAQLDAATAAVLRRKVRPAKTVTVRTVPDPRVELDDVVTAVRGGKTYKGEVLAYDLPLYVGGGQMTTTVGIGS